MKRLLLLVLAVTIISQSLVYVAIGVYFHLNRHYIAQELCINRNNPKMHCNGHCYLSKQLKKAEQGESKSAQVIKEKDEVMTNDCQSVVIIYFPTYTDCGTAVYNTILYSTDDTGCLIKPPAV